MHDMLDGFRITRIRAQKLEYMFVFMAGNDYILCALAVTVSVMFTYINKMSAVFIT